MLHLEPPHNPSQESAPKDKPKDRDRQHQHHRKRAAPRQHLPPRRHHLGRAPAGAGDHPSRPPPAPPPPPSFPTFLSLLPSFLLSLSLAQPLSIRDSASPQPPDSICTISRLHWFGVPDRLSL